MNSLIPEYNPEDQSEGFYYDRKAAELPVLFIEKFIRHVKGDKGGQPLILEDWQKQILRNLFGWKHDDNAKLDRYTKMLLEISRKVGKTTLAAATSLFCLICDNEPSGEIIIAANTQKQAGYLFSIAASMVRASPGLRNRIKILPSRYTMINTATDSSLMACSAEVKANWGTSPNTVIYDELHAATNPDLFDCLSSAQGARSNPKFIVISTSGSDKQSIMYEQHDYALKVRDNIIKDPEYLPVVYSAPDDFDFTDYKNFKKYIPNLGISVKESFIKSELKKAINTPSYQNAFRQLYLSQWTESNKAFISQLQIKSIRNDDFPDLTGFTAHGGLDLSYSKDTSSFSLVFPVDDEFYIKAWTWIPSREAKQRVLKDKIPYDKWLKDPKNNLTYCSTKTINYEDIYQTIIGLTQKYNIVDIHYDKCMANMLVTKLEQDNIELVKFGQFFSSMSSPTKEFEKLIIDNKIWNDNDLFAWQLSNATIEQDSLGSIKIVKPEHNSPRKVDAVIATIMALKGALTYIDTACLMPMVF